MPNQSISTEYIDTTDYKKLERKIKDLVERSDDLQKQNVIARNLRYVDVDIEGERARGKLQPDELFIPVHTIDSNIRREQSFYVQYESQSPRSCILQDIGDESANTAVLEKDVTLRFRYNGWQVPKFANIDGFQQNGYSVMELIYDDSAPGDMVHECVPYGDFAMAVDAKNVQEQEMVLRNYYYSRTKLLELCDPVTNKYPFSREQVDKIIEQQPNVNDVELVYTSKDKSLYCIKKVMFRVKSIVNVAWCLPNTCDDWIREPKPLYIGRRKLIPVISQMMAGINGVTGASIPQSIAEYETDYPYFVFPYLISENGTISQLKGRAFLDQDTQQAVSSLLSSFVTAHRRASGLYFSKEVEDPNDDLLLQKNIFFKSGCLINSKIRQFQLTPPSSDMVSAISLLVTSNQQETSQVNFAERNTKDSRKTATAVNASMIAQQQLTTVQVVLYSNAEGRMSTVRFEILQSRVAAGLVEVSPQLKQLYARKYLVRPAGDVDVVERQQMINTMMQTWPVIQNTAAAPAFLADLLSLMFPDKSGKYIQAIQQQLAQQQSAQAQQQQQLMQRAGQVAAGIKKLAKSPEMFSDIGKVHALPIIESTADEIDTMTGNS